MGVVSIEKPIKHNYRLKKLLFKGVYNIVFVKILEMV